MSIDEPRQATRLYVAATVPPPDMPPPVDDATPNQLAKGNEIIELLKGNDLTIHVTIKDGELEEMPIGRAIDILSQRGAITPRMAIVLKTTYNVTLADLGQTEGQVAQGCERPAEQFADFSSIIDAIQRGARRNFPHKSDEKPIKNPGYGTFTYYVKVRDWNDPSRLSIIEAIAWLKYKKRLTDRQASRLLSACKDSMRRTPNRRRSLKQRLVPKEIAEIEEELGRLEEKAANLVAWEEEFRCLQEAGNIENWITSPEGQQPEEGPEHRTVSPKAARELPDDQPEPYLEILIEDPNLARTRIGRRLALVVGGILLAVGGTAVCTNLSGRNAPKNKAPIAVSAPSEPLTPPIASGSPSSITTPARHASEAEAPSEAATQELKPEATATAPRVAATPQVIPLAQLSPTKAPATIAIPIIIKPSGGGGIKIDTNASRAQWETMGYAVGISTGLNGKIIRLTDSNGNVYLVDTTNLKSGTTESNATLQSAE